MVCSEAAVEDVLMPEYKTQCDGLQVGLQWDHIVTFYKASSF